MDKQLLAIVLVSLAFGGLAALASPIDDNEIASRKDGNPNLLEPESIVMRTLDAMSIVNVSVEAILRDRQSNNVPLSLTLQNLWGVNAERSYLALHYELQMLFDNGKVVAHITADPKAATYKLFYITAELYPGDYTQLRCVTQQIGFVYPSKLRYSCKSKKTVTCYKPGNPGEHSEAVADLVFYNWEFEALNANPNKSELKQFSRPPADQSCSW